MVLRTTTTLHKLFGDGATSAPFDLIKLDVQVRVAVRGEERART